MKKYLGLGLIFSAAIVMWVSATPTRSGAG
jgi:hypothetical protein